jgi:tight adherence protein B
MSPQLLLLMLGLGAAASVGMLALAFSGGPRNQLARRAERIGAKQRGEVTEALMLRRAAATGLDAALLRYIPRRSTLRERLQRTGRSISVTAYVAASLVVAIVGVGLVLLSGFSLGLAVPVGALAGYWIPYLAIGFLIRRQVKRFEALFPEAIGLIIRGLKSGLPVTESMSIVGREVADPVGEEFRRMGDQIRLGQTLEQAMWDTAKRISITEFNFLVISMSVQRETGGNLAETLENLDNILRRRRQMRLKIRAMSSEARASALIIGSLPFIMMGILSFVNPKYIATLFTDPTGHMLLAAGGGSMAIGVLVMSKMVRFEI